MKTIYLFRHSKPDKTTDLKNELIPLSQEGRTLLTQFLARNPINRNLPIVSSPYQRAYETAKLIGSNVTTDDRLIERKTGLFFTKDIWTGQYTDTDLRSEDGESFKMVRHRMTEVLNELLSQMTDNEAVIVVSHAAAICAYLQQFCEITVTDADKKQRRITFHDNVILDGTIDTPSCFELVFKDNHLSRMSYKS